MAFMLDKKYAHYPVCQRSYKINCTDKIFNHRRQGYIMGPDWCDLYKL